MAGTVSDGSRTNMILAAGAWAWIRLRTRLNQSVVAMAGGGVAGVLPVDETTDGHAVVLCSSKLSFQAAIAIRIVG